jgi:hypothetical protein
MLPAHCGHPAHSFRKGVVEELDFFNKTRDFSQYPSSGTPVAAFPVTTARSFGKQKLILAEIPQQRGFAVAFGDSMQASIFNVCVPLPARDEVFLMNTLTDAQFVVSSDVAALLAHGDLDQANLDGDEVRDALALLNDNGFLCEGEGLRTREGLGTSVMLTARRP